MRMNAVPVGSLRLPGSERSPLRGFTLVELLVVIAIIGLLIAILMPAMSKVTDGARLSVSLANLRNMVAAAGSYSADWADRQPTAMPDDAGLAGGDCATYLSTIACPPQQLLGWSTSGGMWGYFLGSSGKCAGTGQGGDCGNWVMYKPIEFGGPNAGIGAFRLPNAKSFSGYVNNKYYDPVFWAPKDRITLEVVTPMLSLPGQFEGTPGFAFSSYCWSPAAMYAPDVLSSKGYTNPNALAGGYRSPAVGMATYPDLKTRMLEHAWLQNAESQVNPNFAGGNEPWYFNHGYNSAPATMFFDGHVTSMGVQEAMEADKRVAGTAVPGLAEKGLWHRSSPFGADGYFGGQSYDFLVKTSYHILTTDGIQGRDTIGAH